MTGSSCYNVQKMENVFIVVIHHIKYEIVQRSTLEEDLVAQGMANLQIPINGNDFPKETAIPRATQKVEEVNLLQK